MHVKLNLHPVDTVYLRSDGGKHTARNPHLVTSVDGKTVTAQKMLHFTLQHGVPMRITAPKPQIDDKFLYIQPPKRQRTQAIISARLHRKNIARMHNKHNARTHRAT